jgi:hypothetical protein
MYLNVGQDLLSAPDEHKPAFRFYALKYVKLYPR